MGASQGTFVARELGAADEAELAGLGARRRILAAGRPRSLAPAEGELPADLERRRAWGAFEPSSGGAGRLVACVAGLVQRVALPDAGAGEEAAWCLVAELLCDPRSPRGLARHAPVLAAARAFAGALGGPAPGGHPVLYGFPSRAAFRLGCYRLEGDVVRNQNALVLAPERLAAEDGSGIELADVERLSGEADELFARAKTGCGALAVRDAAEANRRHAGRPGTRMVTARRGGALAGWAVLRRGAYDGDEAGLVVDWLVPADELRAAAALRAGLAERARAAGVGRLVALFPDTCPEWIAFQNAGFRILPSADYLMVRAFQRPWDVSWLRRRWYYTLADFEAGGGAP